MHVLMRLSLFLWRSKKRDQLGFRTPFKKLNSTRIATIVEKGFKFLLFKTCQGKHSVHQQLFTEAYFVLMFSFHICYHMSIPGQSRPVEVLIASDLNCFVRGETGGSTHLMGTVASAPLWAAFEPRFSCPQAVGPSKLIQTPCASVSSSAIWR